MMLAGGVAHVCPKDEPHDEPPNEVPRSEAGLAAFPAAPLLKQGLQATARLGRGITGRTLSVGDRSLPDLNVIQKMQHSIVHV